MTMNNHHVGADADEPEGFDWAAREVEMAEQRWAEGRPTPADIAAAQGLDPDADAELWPQVLDAKGRPTGEIARPNPEAMRAALYRASSTDPAEVDYLAEAVSPAEARAIIAQAARQRETERVLEADLAELRARLAAGGARRQAEHEADMAEARRKRENRAEAALERRDRALDPTSRVVRLAFAQRWLPVITTLPAVAAVAIGAVNVGSELARINPETTWVGYGVELMLTVPLLMILLAQVLGAVPHDRTNPYKALEWTLGIAAVALNVGVHLVPADSGAAASVVGAAVWMIVPAGLGIAAYLVPRLSRDILAAFTDTAADSHSAVAAVSAASRSGFATTSSASSRSVPEGVPEGVPALGADGDRDLAAEFADALRTGRTDATGRPMNPRSAKSIRTALRIRHEAAAALRDQYKTAMSDTE